MSNLIALALSGALTIAANPVAIAQPAPIPHAAPIKRDTMQKIINDCDELETHELTIESADCESLSLAPDLLD